MSRWKVRREWRDTLDAYSWVVLRPSGLSGDVFPTWREALDYADRMARTRDRITAEIERTPAELQAARITLHAERVHMLALCTHLLNGDTE